MRKINIQRDLESRRNISQIMPPVREFETEVEREKEKEEENAESEVIQGNADDTVASAGEKPKKRKRTPAGDLPALPV
jgi:hypothetical protein